MNSELDYTHQDNDGNTISHIMSYNLASDLEYADMLISYYVKIINILLPYRDKLKVNYNILNKQHKTPGSILEQIFQSDIPNYLECDLFDHGLTNFITKRIDPEVTVYSKPSPEVQKYLSQINMEAFDIENHIVFSLSFVIAYTECNEWGDTALLVMAQRDNTNIFREKIIKHILKILPQELVYYISYTSNKIGQYLVHSTIQSESIDTLRFLGRLNPSLLNQKTIHHFTAVEIKEINTDKVKQTIDASTLMFKLSPTDYAVLCNKINVLKTLGLISFEHGISVNKPVIQLDTHFKENIISTIDENPEYLAYFKDTQDKHTIDMQLLNKYKEVITSKQQQVNTDLYAPVSQNLMEYLIKEHHITPIPTTTWDFDELRTGLNEWHENNIIAPLSSSKILSTIILDQGHATALVICYIKRKGQYYAYYQDSEGIKNKARFHIIKSILLQKLLIPELNIFNFGIQQQFNNNYNCGLWSLLNTKIITEHLVRTANSIYNDIVGRCIGATHCRQEITPCTTDEQLTKIKEQMSSEHTKDIMQKVYKEVVTTFRKQYTQNSINSITEIIKILSGTIDINNKSLEKKVISVGDMQFFIATKYKHIFDLDIQNLVMYSIC